MVVGTPLTVCPTGRPITVDVNSPGSAGSKTRTGQSRSQVRWSEIASCHLMAEHCGPIMCGTSETALTITIMCFEPDMGHRLYLLKGFPIPSLAPIIGQS